jgi:hypothetical protein
MSEDWLGLQWIIAQYLVELWLVLIFNAFKSNPNVNKITKLKEAGLG